MSQLSHPNTARVFLYGQLEDGACYFVMEYLEGKNLAQCIRSEGPFPLERVVRIMGRVCEALDEAHRMGIIHRDLKPENIFLTTQGGIPDFPKVLDFGLAKVSEQQLRPTSLVLTRQGMIFGTPEFMSPEQAKGENIDHRSDIYSLAVIAYELLTGKLPFDAKHSLEYLQKHIREPPIPISVRLPDREWPRGLWEVLAKALAKRPEDRFESAGAFGKALEQVLEGALTGQEPSLGTSGGSSEPEALERGTIPDLHEFSQPSQEPPRVPVPRIAWVVFGIGAFLALVAIAALILTWILLRQGAS